MVGGKTPEEGRGVVVGASSGYLVWLSGYWSVPVAPARCGTQERRGTGLVVQPSSRATTEFSTCEVGSQLENRKGGTYLSGFIVSSRLTRRWVISTSPSPLTGEYARKAEVTAQIKALPRPGTKECLDDLATFGAGYFPETLVYLMRAAMRIGDRDLSDAAASLLLGTPQMSGEFKPGVRLIIWNVEEPIEGKTLEKFLVDYLHWSELQGDRDGINEFRAHLHERIFLAVEAGDKQPFWEVNFREAVERALFRVWDDLHTRKRQLRAHENDGVAADTVAQTHSSPERAYVRAESKTALQLALLSLPDDERLVVEQLYLHPTRDKALTQAKLAAELGVTERTIRNRRDAAFTKLRALLGSADYWFLHEEGEVLEPHVQKQSTPRPADVSEEKTG